MSHSSTEARAATAPDAATRVDALRNVGAWFGRLLVVGAMGQVIYFFVSREGWLLASGGGRSFVMIFAVLVTLAFMGTSAASLGAGGLAISSRWARDLLIGLVIGLLGAAVWLGVTVLSGALAFEADELGSILGDLFEGAAGGPLVALVIAMIIPGWLFGELRRGWPLLMTIAASSMLGAGMITLISPELILEDGAWGRLPTLVLTLSLLGALRARTGDLVLAFALLAGGLMVLRTARKADMLETAAEGGAWASVLAPAGDVLAAPASWVILGAATMAGLVWPRSRRERRTLDFEPTFKRMQVFSHLGVLAPLDVWIRVLNESKWKIDAPYLGRFVATMISSTLSLIVTLPERLFAPALLARRTIPPPLFVLGVHRSGTTHLQNLLALDPRFACARTRHVFDPYGFLVTGWLMAPLLWAVLPLKRPQDSVKFGLFSPNEEEYALANMSHLSPDWSVRLPRRRKTYDRYLYPDGFSDEERTKWTRHYRVFLAKLSLLSRGRRPLLKNPFNTGRAGMLREAFPDAQFVHIQRDPIAVYRSYLHLARSAHPLFQLQDEPDEATLGERFCDIYRRMEDRYAEDAKAMPTGTACDVRFEDLETDPIGEIRRIYGALQLEFTPEYERRLERYVEANRSYKKNVYRKALPEAERRMVEEKLGPFNGGGEA